MGGRDTGPTPGEVLLAALGGCVGMTYILKAAARGVDIDELEVDIEAGWDVQGLFELDSVPAGLSRVAVTVGVRTSATDRVLDDIGEITTRTPAVYNSLADPVLNRTVGATHAVGRQEPLRRGDLHTDYRT